MFGGVVSKYTHQSAATKTEMTFSIFMPALAEGAKCPVIYYLSGLTCTDDNFTQKAGAQRAAAAAGVALVAPDTSPRGLDIEGEHDKYDFGSGAGFYVNATEDLWKENYNMDTYVNEELPGLIAENFAVSDKAAIMGHSMGGHGALTQALRNPGKYVSASAFSPICHPSKCPWGVKAFTGYLGADESKWADYDATLLAGKYAGPALPVLIDQGAADEFLTSKQLLPEALEEAAKGNDNIKLEMRMQEGYDHSYYFIASFVEDHVKFHAANF